MQNNFIDLSQRPPRSARVRLGGYVILPRMLDKGRAVLAGKQHDYKYACPLDQQFLNFAGIDPDKLKEQLTAGKGDGEILEWVQANAKNHHTPEQITHWSSAQEQRGPGDADSRQFFNKLKSDVAPKRNDISAWFDLLDVDDYVSYGGKA
jgi:hypothetical protein